MYRGLALQRYNFAPTVLQIPTLFMFVKHVPFNWLLLQCHFPTHETPYQVATLDAVMSFICHQLALR
jgi:hypothetical protein